MGTSSAFVCKSIQSFFTRFCVGRNSFRVCIFRLISFLVALFSKPSFPTRYKSRSKCNAALCFFRFIPHENDRRAKTSILFALISGDSTFLNMQILRFGRAAQFGKWPGDFSLSPVNNEYRRAAFPIGRHTSGTWMSEE